MDTKYQFLLYFVILRNFFKESYFFLNIVLIFYVSLVKLKLIYHHKIFFSKTNKLIYFKISLIK